MNNELSQRENRVMDFINAKNKQIEQQRMDQAIINNPEIKMKKLDAECNDATSICIDTILGRLYKDALPFDDCKKNMSDGEARDEIHAYITDRCNGKNSEYYIKEAIKRTDSPKLKTLLTEAQKSCKEFHKCKSKDIGKLSIKDLNYRKYLDEDQVTKISARMEFDEISDIIRQNVEKSIDEEVNKTKKEDEYTKMIEDKLAQDNSVVDQASMESALEKLRRYDEPRVFQPSLFSAIMMGKSSVMTESATEDVFVETIREYTKLNIIKALKLENFSINKIKNLANDYLR